MGVWRERENYIQYVFVIVTCTQADCFKTVQMLVPNYLKLSDK